VENSMDTEFDQLRARVEKDLGVTLDEGEQIVLRGLFYFGKGLKLREKAEPQRIGEVLPGVMKDIRRRCEQNPNNPDFPPQRHSRTDRVLDAVRGFMGRKGPRHRRAKSRRFRPIDAKHNAKLQIGGSVNTELTRD